MTEDYFNGLNIVPLSHGHSILSSTAVSDTHPWRDLVCPREEPVPEIWRDPPSIEKPPPYYMCDSQLLAPSPIDTKKSYGGPSVRSVRETVRLCDVEAFRTSTAEKVRTVDIEDKMAELSAGITGLSTSSSPSIRPVIYRYIDVIKNSFALLEAIHFELFMPDRSDLRFLAVPFNTVPSGTIEGDYFRISDANLLSDPSFAVKLGKVEYPVVWKTTIIETIQPAYNFSLMYTEDGLAYIMRTKSMARPGHVEALFPSHDFDGIYGELFIRETLLPDEDSRREHSLVRITKRNMATAHIYPVEPPLPPPLHETSSVSDSKNWRVDGARSVFAPCSEYLKRVSGVCTSSQRSGRVVSAARAPCANEMHHINNRLGDYKPMDDFINLDQMEELFRLGSLFRVRASCGVDAKDAGEMRIDESIILKTAGDGSICSERCEWTLRRIYGRNSRDIDVYEKLETPPQLHKVSYGDGSGELQLNEQQSLAVSLYTTEVCIFRDTNGPLVFCILSPPGSGKTTVAAAMAAEAERRVNEIGLGGVQLLLSVQNVAVDNIGAALKKMGGAKYPVYNMKSTKNLDPHNPAPFDFFDLMSKEELEKWKYDKIPMTKEVVRKPNSRDRTTAELRFKTKEERLTHYRREYEKKIYHPGILLGTVEMVLQKMYTNSALCHDLSNVKRVIIDEASLLTEAALYCIIKRFPEARIVLIGDEKQLPPFMYDEKILGHELAGRPALSVAMRTGLVPVVELNEVYRAPPSMVAPYNRLSYGGKLNSKKSEGDSPLSVVGLIHTGMPQLLLIDVDGKEERNEKSMSLYNTKEISALLRLLKKLPFGWSRDIMIICLYRDQKKRLQEILNKQYTILTGKEAPIVIVMTTRTQRATDFFCSTERCNVAVSRQQKSLIILGKAPLLMTNKPWSTVVNGDDFTRIKAEDIK